MSRSRTIKVAFPGWTLMGKATAEEAEDAEQDEEAEAEADAEIEGEEAKAKAQTPVIGL